MKVVVQRSKKSSVVVNNEIVGAIDYGLVILVGFTHNDTIDDLNYVVKKIVNLRIFDDENGVMNKSVIDIKGSILSVSQFTLYANTKKGNRPSYIDAMASSSANELYQEFNRLLSAYVPVATGIFQAEMQVNITNDGPITIIIDSQNR